jgi:NAD(P)-dependent dehydrogenase (short-subunit alcohol dehydrogenase family)
MSNSRHTAKELENVGICDGRVVVITAAGGGIGREHAIEFASQGAKLVINDLGAEVDGSGSSDGPAGQVVEEIRGTGGEAAGSPRVFEARRAMAPAATRHRALTSRARWNPAVSASWGGV